MHLPDDASPVVYVELGESMSLHKIGHFNADPTTTYLKFALLSSLLFILVSFQSFVGWQMASTSSGPSTSPRTSRVLRVKSHSPTGTRGEVVTPTSRLARPLS